MICHQVHYCWGNLEAWVRLLEHSWRLPGRVKGSAVFAFAPSPFYRIRQTGGSSRMRWRHVEHARYFIPCKQPVDAANSYPVRLAVTKPLQRQRLGKIYHSFLEVQVPRGVPHQSRRGNHLYSSSSFRDKFTLLVRERQEISSEPEHDFLSGFKSSRGTGQKSAQLRHVTRR